MLRRSFLKGLGASLAGGFVFAGKATKEALAKPLPEVELPCDYGTYSVVDVPPAGFNIEVTNDALRTARHSIADLVMPEARYHFQMLDTQRFGSEVAELTKDVRCHVYEDSYLRRKRGITIFMVRRPSIRLPVRDHAEA